jgi:integrase
VAKRTLKNGTSTYEREHGKGSLYQDRANGCWVGSLTVRLPDGTRKRRTVRGKTKTEASRKLDRLLQDQAEGIETPAKYTVQKAVDAWLDRGLSGKSPRTVELYRGRLAPVVKLIGHKPLVSLKPDDIHDVLTTIGENTSTRNVQITHNCLTRVIDHAQRNRRVNWNAASLAERPEGKGKGRPSNALTPEQATALLAAAKGTRLEAYVTLSLMTGMRTEEARALRWDHVDLEAGTVAVWRAVRNGGDTKTVKSRRTLKLPQAVIQALREHKAQQAEDRLKAGSAWQDNGLVFASTVGTPLDRYNVRREFRNITEKAGLGRGWAPRELRHSFVSVLSANGVTIEEIARLAGHSTTRTTELVYRKELRPVLTFGAEVMDAIFS